MLSDRRSCVACYVAIFSIVQIFCFKKNTRMDDLKKATV